jgi:hypothetical protein
MSEDKWLLFILPHGAARLRIPIHRMKKDSQLLKQSEVFFNTNSLGNVHGALPFKPQAEFIQLLSFFAVFSCVR